MKLQKANQKDIKWMKWCEGGASIFSTCAKKSYMSIIVDSTGRVDATGYNGPPSGFTHCFDGGCNRFINNAPSGSPYDSGDGLCYSIHAEMNALIHSNASLRKEGTMYVNGQPCFNCAKVIINSGLKRLVYLSEGHERLDNDVTIDILEKSSLIITIIERKEI